MPRDGKNSATARIWHSRFVTPIIKVGRFALPVFFLSVVLDYLGSFVLIATGGGLLLELALCLAVLAMMMLAAERLARRRAKRDLMAAPAPAVAAAAQRAVA